MKKLLLTNHAQNDTVVLENDFIDRYMTSANGEFVKVYLLLLRYLNTPAGLPTVSTIADLLNLTEKDVIRALNYWKKQGLLDYETTADIPASDAVSRTAAADNTAAVPDIRQYRSRKEFKEILFVAEQYLGKTLSSTDIDTITYFYETLNMSAELIDYLIEYCVENGHKSMHYIKKVALSWNERQIRTVEDAKAGSLQYNKSCYSIMNAFGFKGRAPVPSELKWIRKWSDEYAFSLELILEACGRTMNTIHQPSFEYTDSILRDWMEKGVRHTSDIKAVDAEHQSEKKRRRNQTSKAAAPKNKFNNFEGRSYDMDELERQLIQQ